MTAVGFWVAFGARWKPVEVGSDRVGGGGLSIALQT